jgi:hypothetical protein
MSNNRGKRACLFDGCEKPYQGKGYCAGHRVQIKQGRPLAPLKGKALTVDERFDAMVTADEGTECLVWTGAPNTSGYGGILVNGKYWRAHRYALARTGVRVEESDLVDHVCHNRLCVNPSHLRIVTKSENAQNRRSATAKSKSGIRGVSYSPQRREWVAVVGYEGQRYVAGHFQNFMDAEFAAVTTRARIHTVHSEYDRQYLSRRGLSVEDFKTKKGVSA